MSNKKVMLKEIEYQIKKLDNYKLIFTDGVWGGTTNNGLIRMELFSESRIAQSVKHEIKNGLLGKEIERVPKDDDEKIVILRETQLGTVMTVKTAKAILKWLKEKCDELEKVQ